MSNSRNSGNLDRPSLDDLRKRTQVQPTTDSGNRNRGKPCEPLTLRAWLEATERLTPILGEESSVEIIRRLRDNAAH